MKIYECEYNFLYIPHEISIYFTKFVLVSDNSVEYFMLFYSNIQYETLNIRIPKWIPSTKIKDGKLAL